MYGKRELVFYCFMLATKITKTAFVVFMDKIYVSKFLKRTFKIFK